MNQWFVTATGTDIGKTFASAAIIHQARAAGQSVRAFKPVISGYTADGHGESDTGILMDALGLPLSDQSLDTMSPFRFTEAVSPDMAAAREGREISAQALIDASRSFLASPADLALIEGVGGAFVPLNGDFLVADWIEALGIPSLLVAGSYLGTISHTVATVEALRARGITPRAIIISQSVDEPVPLAETTDAVRRLTAIADVFALPRQESGDWRQAGNVHAFLSTLA